jgi:hypothetical protein
MSFPHIANNGSEPPSGTHRRPNSWCTTNNRKQHGDKLVKLNEILNEVAPPMRNIQQQFGEGAGHFKFEQEVQENQRAKDWRGGVW